MFAFVLLLLDLFLLSGCAEPKKIKKEQVTERKEEGAWIYDVSYDDFTKETKIVASVTSFKPSTGTFSVVCETKPRSPERSYFVAIQASQFLGETESGSPKEIFYIVDDQPTVREKWIYGVASAFKRPPPPVTDFLHQLANSSRLRLRAQNSLYKNVDFDFNVKGFDLVLARMFRDCDPHKNGA